MSSFKLPVANVATAVTSKNVSVTVASTGPAKADGSPITAADLTPSLLHDSDPGVAALGQGKILANQAAGVFKNAN